MKNKLSAGDSFYDPKACEVWVAVMVFGKILMTKRRYLWEASSEELEELIKMED